MKDKKIRILCAVTALLSVAAIIPLMFEFVEYASTDIHGLQFFYSVWGVGIYSDTENWYFILLGVLGIISLLWNLVYCAYAVIDGRYRNLTWRIARYGYFFGAIVGLINAAAILSFLSFTCLLPAAYVFVVLIVAAVALETTLLFLKDEDSKKS